MRGTIASVLVVMLLCIVSPALSAAEEELFDTKAASAALESGLKLIKQKKFDAAVEALEEAAATSPDIEAEALYYAGYACYLKSRSGDEDARQRSVEFFDRAYEINPNFSPNKVRPADIIAAPGAQQGGDITPASAAPAGTLAVPAVPPATPAPAQQPPSPGNQPMQ